MRGGMNIVETTAFVPGRRRTRRGLVAAWSMLAAVTLAGAACSGGARPAARASPVPVRAGYLALGGSIAFGYRPSSVTPTADCRNPADFTGYPEDVARTLGLDLANALSTTIIWEPDRIPTPSGARQQLRGQTA